jgi:dTMP kinase
MTEGRFITFESIDGVGKTTQMKRLADWLRGSGVEVYLTKEPGDAYMGSNIGVGIRHLVFKEPSTINLRPGVADMLFLADHIQTAGDVAEAVAAGKVVLCDRYADSQFAYSTAESKRSPAWTVEAFRQNYGMVPDITILLVARGPNTVWAPASLTSTAYRQPIEDFSWALDRAKGRSGAEAGKQDGKCWNSIEEQRTIQDAYIAQLAPQPRCLLIDVWEQDSREQVEERIQMRLAHALSGLKQLRVA